MISRFRMTASNVFESDLKSSSVIPTVYSAIFRQALSMSSRKRCSSRCTNGLAKDALPEAGLDRALEHQINTASEERLEELFEIHVVIERLHAEFDEEIEVAVVARLISGIRAEKCQLAHRELLEALAMRCNRRQYFVARHDRVQCGYLNSAATLIQTWLNAL